MEPITDNQDYSVYRDSKDQVIFQLHHENDLWRLRQAFKTQRKGYLTESTALNDLWNLVQTGQYHYVLAGCDGTTGYLRISKDSFGG